MSYLATNTIRKKNSFYHFPHVSSTEIKRVESYQAAVFDLGWCKSANIGPYRTIIDPVLVFFFLCFHILLPNHRVTAKQHV